jgi:hypothetical protein
VDEVFLQTGLSPSCAELLLPEAVAAVEPLEAPEEPVVNIQLAGRDSRGPLPARPLDQGGEVLSQREELLLIQGGKYRDVAAVRIADQEEDLVDRLKRNLGGGELHTTVVHILAERVAEATVLGGDSPAPPAPPAPRRPTERPAERSCGPSPQMRWPQQ